MRVSVILPAAGLGTRMGRPKAEASPSASRKQFLQLDGLPVLIHTIRKFAVSPDVTEIVVALRHEDLQWFSELVAKENFAKPVRLIEGGDSRQ